MNVGVFELGRLTSKTSVYKLSRDLLEIAWKYVEGFNRFDLGSRLKAKAIYYFVWVTALVL